jgi:ABC-type sugar transport system ATPase subunit
MHAPLHLELRSIVKRYDTQSEAVKDVSLQVQPGEFLVLVGPSGCGKSTLLRMIAGLETITAGDLLFDSVRMNDVSARDRDIGMVFQNYALYPHLNVFENIAFPLRVRKQTEPVVRARVNEVAEMLSLGSLLERLPKQLSGGQRQRVAVGRAIARKPRLFLFDEPLSNLDAQLRIAMRSELTYLQRQVGTTAVYVTHDHTEAMTMGSRIAVLRDGTLQQVGTPQDLYYNPCNSFVASFLGTPSMNMIPGRIVRQDGLHFRSNDYGWMMSLNNHVSASVSSLAEGATCTLGIRAEDLLPDTSGEISLPVRAVEFVGHETLMFLGEPGKFITARTHASAVPVTDTVAGFRIRRERAHLFNDNGERM